MASQPSLLFMRSEVLYPTNEAQPATVRVVRAL